ncbi:hypothetical protein [Mycoplasma seminis]|uniref:Uncharacterized protein n=1 Tax=Mycoplasma seminis TaxID=512749 RepID=A0ABY9HAT8_9MOLU|nr:hypothetical protein [Mycoplasma seminis]WLP85712.1 hypothetical protein Q8852_00965 [Mycoplasma seminis]
MDFNKTLKRDFLIHNIWFPFSWLLMIIGAVLLIIGVSEIIDSDLNITLDWKFYAGLGILALGSLPYRIWSYIAGVRFRSHLNNDFAVLDEFSKDFSKGKKSWFNLFIFIYCGAFFTAKYKNYRDAKNQDILEQK